MAGAQIISSRDAGADELPFSSTGDSNAGGPVVPKRFWEGCARVISGKDDPKFVAVMVLIPVMILALIVGFTDPDYTHVLVAWAVGLATLCFWTFVAWSEWRSQR